jgi:hypothetical protein
MADRTAKAGETQTPPPDCVQTCIEYAACQAHACN